jgi:hypothetical protein
MPAIFVISLSQRINHITQDDKMQYNKAKKMYVSACIVKLELNHSLHSLNSAEKNASIITFLNNIYNEYNCSDFFIAINVYAVCMNDGWFQMIEIIFLVYGNYRWKKC